MDFYTYHYLQVHQQAFTLVGYGITIAASLLVLYYSWRYFRHRFVTRYRDLSVILLLIVLILVGVQVEQVLAKHQNQWQANQIIPFVLAVAKDHNLKPSQMMVNQTTLKDGLLVRFAGRDYQLQLSADHNSYVLQRAHVIDHQVRVNR